MLEKMALALQQECHQEVENLAVVVGFPSNRDELQEKIRDGQLCWVIKKLAEYEIRLQRMESLLAI